MRVLPLVFHSPPNVTGETFQVLPNTPFIFTDNDLLANDVSHNGGPLKVVSWKAVGTPTGWIHQYTANPIGQYAYIPKEFTANKVEKMTYVVEDSRGQQATGTATFRVGEHAGQWGDCCNGLAAAKLLLQ
jgi:hypothetical protein